MRVRYHRRVRGAVPVLGLFAVLSTATAGAAGPLADPAPWVLPVNAFAKARVGDWTLLEGDAVLNGKPVHLRQIIRVAALKGGVADVQLFEGPAGREGWFLTFPVDVKRGPDTNLLYDLPWIAVDPKPEKATCTLGAARFDCTRVTYRTPSHRVTALMAARVRGSGLVGFEVVPTGGGAPLWSMRTIGYGAAGKVEWGAGPPPADLQGDWDGGAKPSGQREGSEPATVDVWEQELPPLAIPPRADLTDCKVMGDRDRGSVMRLLLRRLMAIEDCYLAALAGKPKPRGGDATMTFVIDELAAVTDLKDTGTAAPAVRRCAADVVSAVQFPFADAAGVSQVVCTFTFDPGKPAPPLRRPLKKKLVTRGHPARGGPDLRGAARIP